MDELFIEPKSIDAHGDVVTEPEDEYAEFFGLYIRNADGTCEHLLDRDTREECEELIKRLTK